MKATTDEAYNYAKRKKKVNEGVIEAYINGHDIGYKRALNSSDDILIEALQKKYRSKHDVEYGLVMSDARRGINDKERYEIQIRNLIDKFKEQINILKNEKDK